MNLSDKALWIAGGIAVVAIVCCIALGIALHSEDKVEDRQQADIKALSTVRDADNSAQLVNDAAIKKAEEDAQKKAAIIDSIPTDLHGSALVRELQRGLRGGGEDTNSGSGPTGKPAGILSGTNDAAGTDENERP